MLLRLSSRQDGREADLISVTRDAGDAGVEHGDWLRRLTEATIKRDWLTLADIRPQAEQAMGRQQVVDALTVAAAFNGITRVADATGVPLDADTREHTGEMRTATGIQQFDYAEKSRRYDATNPP